MLALATFAGELLEVFDELGLGLDSDTRGDSLKLMREALLSVATQVIYLVSRDQDRACIPYRSAWSACSLVYAPQMPLYIQRRSARSILPILTLRGITPIHTRALTRYF